MSPEVPIASPLPALDAFLAGSSLPAVNSVPEAQLDSPFAGGRNRPRAAPATCLDSLSNCAKRSKGSNGRASPFSSMIRSRGIQSVRSPKIKWPTMSNALQVSPPSLRRTHMLGSPRNSAFRVAGVRVRTAMASARLNSVKFAILGRCMPGALDSSDGAQTALNP